MRRRWIPWAAAAWVAAGAAAAGPPERRPILNEDGCFRQYYQFGLMRISPDALRAEGAKLLGRSGLDRLKRETLAHLRDREIDWQEADWRDHACVHFRRTQLGDDSRAVEMIRTAPPPGEWAEAGFDDGSWLRQRVGRLPQRRYHMEAYDYSWHLVRAMYLRSYFHVSDPASAGDLALSVRFRGGARVLVNGAEIARAHLPAGPLGPDAPAEDYPREAYVSLPNEAPDGRGGICADIRCAFEEAPDGAGRRKEWAGYRLNASGQPLNRKGWERIRRLRDRRLENVPIPARRLRKGTNVLAIEIRAARFHPQILPGAGGPRADNWGRHGGTENHTWHHVRLLSLELSGGRGKVAPANVRPPGVQLWADDMHRRLFSPDFSPAGAPPGTVRISAAPNGTFSGMLVLGTDRQLTGLKAAVTDLRAGASAIPASAVSVAYLKGHSILELSDLGQGRCLGHYQWDCPMAVVAVSRYRVALTDPPADARARQAAWQKMMQDFRFFDHVAADPPPAVPAGTCQPIWLTLRVPGDARAGTYRGTVTVSAEGMQAASLPIQAEVVNWRVPGPRDFQTIVQSEQSPYGVAKAYGVAPWSQEHWRLLEVSFRQLARLGADWLFVPVLMHSEFGNRDDTSMVRWVRRGDGSLDFDYRVLDRYLDLAIRHWGAVRVICFQIMHGVGSATNHVKVLDETTGAEAAVDVGPGAEAARRPLWRAFARSVLAHMRRRGLDRSVYWGHAFDRVYDPGLVKLMAEFAPGVYWAAGAHARRPDRTFRAVARTYGSDMTDRSFRGWKNPFIHLVMPRSNGSVICVEGTSTPFTYRVLADRGIYCGFNGVGRMGADYFRRTWFDGFRGGEYLLVGRSCVQTLWPGPRGAESSTRNEAMLEGIQEAEARIFLEQALDRGALPDDLAAHARQVLDDHFRGALHIPGGTAALSMMEYTGDWQARSRRLFAAAGKVAEHLGVDVDKTTIGAEELETVFYGETRKAHARRGVALPALGSARVSVKLRNWTARPRRWQARASEAWIRPARTDGALEGFQELAIDLDGGAFQAGQIASGTVTVTDVAAGRSWPVRITAEIVKPVELIVKNTGFNVPVGGSQSRDFLLVNRTDRAQAWRAAASDGWLTVEPASGELPARGSTFVKVTAAPPDGSPARQAPTLTLTALGGKLSERFAFETFVIPPYVRPERPQGAAVPLGRVSKELLVRHVSTNWFDAGKTYRQPAIAQTLNVWHGHQPLVIGNKIYDVGLWVLPPHETVYDVQGKGYAALSAEVGWNAMVARSSGAGRGHETFRLSFEVFLDDRIVAQSGLMKATDDPRLLAVTIPPGAKRLTLRTRATANLERARSIAYANWAVPTLFRRP